MTKTNQRLRIAIITGSLLGILCIIGMGYRFGFQGHAWFLFSAWFNRFIMGLVIGLAGNMIVVKGKWNVPVRGAILGLLISGSFYSATGFADPMGFVAGIVYGIIIDFVATKYS